MSWLKLKSPASILAKRGVPLTIEAFKASSASYSQSGEDSFVSSLFSREGPKRYYLDLGCYHPLKLSNTYHFYRRGWRGLAVDASPLYEREWKRYRPRDVFKRAAIVPTSNDIAIRYVQNKDYPATNRVEVASGNEAPESGLESLAITELPIWWPFHEPPAIVSCDLEGLDFDIWINFPFDMVRPDCIILELLDSSQRNKLENHLARQGYVLCGIMGVSHVFKISSEP